MDAWSVRVVVALIDITVIFERQQTTQQDKVAITMTKGEAK